MCRLSLRCSPLDRVAVCRARPRALACKPRARALRRPSHASVKACKQTLGGARRGALAGMPQLARASPAPLTNTRTHTYTNSHLMLQAAAQVAGGCAGLPPAHRARNQRRCRAEQVQARNSIAPGTNGPAGAAHRERRTAHLAGHASCGLPSLAATQGGIRSSSWPESQAINAEWSTQARPAPAAAVGPTSPCRRLGGARLRRRVETCERWLARLRPGLWPRRALTPGPPRQLSRRLAFAQLEVWRQRDGPRRCSRNGVFSARAAVQAALALGKGRHHGCAGHRSCRKLSGRPLQGC